MKIYTKFNLGQQIYYMKDNKVTSHEVLEIKIGVEYNHYFAKDVLINYKLNNGAIYEEEDIFATKQDLLDSL